MPQFIHAVQKTQAIFLEASATLPKSSLYSNKALFSEPIVHRAFRSNCQEWRLNSAIKGVEGAVKRKEV